MALLGDLECFWTGRCIYCFILPRIDVARLFWYDHRPPPIIRPYIHEFLVIGTLWTLEYSQPLLPQYRFNPYAYGTAYFTISLSVNIVLTLLIIARLVMYRRRVANSMPADHANHYVSLAAIMVESAALYSIFAFIFIIAYGIQHPIYEALLTIAPSTQVRSLSSAIPGSHQRPGYVTC